MYAVLTHDVQNAAHELKHTGETAARKVLNKAEAVAHGVAAGRDRAKLEDPSSGVHQQLAAGADYQKHKAHETAAHLQSQYASRP